MSILTITNSYKPTLPVQSYCFQARWDCQDEFHGCPGLCGSITYVNLYGDEITDSGYCTDDGIIQIEANSIISYTGLKPVTCIPEYV